MNEREFMATANATSAAATGARHAETGRVWRAIDIPLIC
jgi:hypothetical protein